MRGKLIPCYACARSLPTRATNPAITNSQQRCRPNVALLDPMSHLWFVIWAGMFFSDWCSGTSISGKPHQCTMNQINWSNKIGERTMQMLLSRPSLLLMGVFAAVVPSAVVGRSLGHDERRCPPTLFSCYDPAKQTISNMHHANQAALTPSRRYLCAIVFPRKPQSDEDRTNQSEMTVWTNSWNVYSNSHTVRVAG